MGICFPDLERNVSRPWKIREGFFRGLELFGTGFSEGWKFSGGSVCGGGKERAPFSKHWKNGTVFSKGWKTAKP